MSQGSERRPGPGRDQQHADPGAWDHLGRLIRERRAELGLTQREVHSVGGPSPATLYQLETGHRDSYRPHILRRLERALGWGAGSVRSILAGDLPVPDGESDTRSPRHDRRTSWTPPDERQSALDSHEWMAGFRRLPIGTRDKLVILSSLLQETIADLDPRPHGRSTVDGGATLRNDAFPDLPAVPPRSGKEARTT